MAKIGAVRYFSLLLGIFGLIPLAWPAGTTNVVPFSENFERYPNGTALVDGTNGWYASSSAVVVQTNVVYSGTNAAMLPADTYLSNRFIQVANSNIWVTMYARPSLDNAGRMANYELSTNSTAIFYVNTGGYCVVYNGAGGWSEITAMLDGSVPPRIASNDWSRFDLRLNHNSRTWAFFANYQLLSTNISFASTNSSFSGFDVHGAGLEQTNYLDDVAVSYTFPSSLLSQTNNWNPVMAVDSTNISRTIWQGQNAASNSIQVWKSSGLLPLLFSNTVSYTNCGAWTNWLSVTPSNSVSYGGYKTVWLVFDTAALPSSNSPYQAIVRIDGNEDYFGTAASNSPYSVLVSVLVQGTPVLRVSPLGLTNSVTAGNRAAGQQIYVANTSAPPRASMTYIVNVDSASTNWISPSPASGTVVDDTNTIALTYLTENLAPGWHTGLVAVTSYGIATQQVPVVMRVNNTPIMSWNAGQRTWTNSITEGQTVAGYNFDVWNGSAAPTGTVRFTLSSGAGWITLSPAGGTSSGERQSISVSYNVSNLPVGTYTNTITCSGVDDSTGSGPVSNSPLTIVSILSVRGKAILATDTDSLTNSVLENCGATSAPAFYIWNGSGAPRAGLNYSIASYPSWMSVNPASGTVTDETNAISIVWSGGSLSPGTYSGSMIVDGVDQLTGSRAAGAPKTINVQLTVLSRTPVNYEKPTIYGPPYIGQTLTVRNGLWQNMNRLTFAYQWQRADNSSGGGMTTLAGETASNHVVVLADRGKYMRIAVTATDNNPTPRSATAYSGLLPTAKIKAAPGDFNSDGLSDLWFFDSATGIWRASFNANSFVEGQYGSAGMIDVPGDYNNDGIMDLGLYEPANAMWYVLFLPSGPSLHGSLFGGLIEETLATPVPADYDGDGQADIALYWQGYWAILYSTLNRIVIVPPFADGNGTPVPGEYDGDGISDPAVYDSGLWTIRNIYGQEWSLRFGEATDLPAPADYDGDAVSDICVYSPASNTWRTIFSSTGLTNSTSFGQVSPTKVPRQGYYDHDPYCDPATIQDLDDYIIWNVTRTTDTNFSFRGQSYQKSINRWRVSW